MAAFLLLTLLLDGCAVMRKDLSPLRASLADAQTRRTQAEKQESEYDKQRDEKYKEAFDKLSKSQQKELLAEKETTSAAKENREVGLIDLQFIPWPAPGHGWRGLQVLGKYGINQLNPPPKIETWKRSKVYCQYSKIS